MTAGDREALEALNCRIDHTAAISRLIATHSELDGDAADALRGIAETLTEIAERIDVIVGLQRGGH